MRLGTLAGAEVIMDLSYPLTPFLAWFVAGAIKFSINSIREKKPSFGLIGYGGLPSNHSGIVCSMATLITLRQGASNPAFGVAVTIAFIVMLDAASLRRQLGDHAIVINELTAGKCGRQALRERVGHTPVEIFAGAMVGVAVAILADNVL